MKKIVSVLLALFCTPAVAQNYLRDDGTFHSVVEGTTNGQLLYNASGLLGGVTQSVSPDGRSGCVRDGVTDCTAGVVAAAALAAAAGVPLMLGYPNGYCITPIQFGGSSPPAGATLAALPYGISVVSPKSAFVSCSSSPTSTAMVSIVNYLAGVPIVPNFTMQPMIIDAGSNNSYTLMLHGSVASNIWATLRGGSVASWYVNADATHPVINSSWNISFDTQSPAISALMKTTDGGVTGVIAVAANRCVINNAYGSAAGDVVQTDYMNDGCTVDAESAIGGYGINLGHMTSGDWIVHTEGNASGGVNGTANTKGLRLYGSSQDGVATLLKACITCVIDVWNNTSTTQERNLGDAISQSVYVKGLPGTTAPSSGQGWIGGDTTNGASIAGNGSVGDVSLRNSTGTVGCYLGHASAIFSCSGYQLNGAAPLNHILLGDGTAYRDSATIPAAVISGAALTRTNDTNVTLTLGGSPTTALVSAASLTLGWSGTLAVSRGGTGLGSGTSGGIPYYSGTTTIASSALLAANALMIGGGAGTAPSTTTTGTGVLTAIGNNLGSAGALAAVNQAQTFTAAQTIANNIALGFNNAAGTLGGTMYQDASNQLTIKLPASSLWQLLGNGGGLLVDYNISNASTFTWTQGFKVIETSDSTSGSTGAVNTLGGIGATKKIFSADTITATNGFVIPTAAKTLTLKQGANGAVGTFVCTGGGTITITNSFIAISDAIVISLNTVGGTITTPPATKAITAATSFQVLCGATDTSTYNYAVIKNAA